MNGLTLGSIYALVALGYTMVYGILLMINFAHSEIFMLGAFAGLLALGLCAVCPPASALLIAFAVAMAVSGIVAVSFVVIFDESPLRVASFLSPLLPLASGGGRGQRLLALL